MMSCTPGVDVSLNWLTAKLTRSFSVPPSIHSWPVCQPSTVGGLRSIWPMTAVAPLKAPTDWPGAGTTS